MRSYEAARRLFTILGACAWALIFVGAVVAIGGMAAAQQIANSGFAGNQSGMAVLAASLPGAGLALAGFFCLAQAQIGRASVDTAELTQQMLKVARDQLDVSQQSLKSGRATPTGFATAAPTDDATASHPLGTTVASDTAGTEPPRTLPPKPGETIEYRGKTIRAVNTGFIFGSTRFTTLEEAQHHIDQDGPALSPQPASLASAMPPIGRGDGPEPGSAT